MANMEIGTHTRNKIRAAIKGKLQELGSYVDEELPDYIMVLVTNKKNAQQMSEDLSLFLGHNSVKFTLWLHEVLEKLHSVAVEPALLRPQYLHADVSIGNGQEQGQAERGGLELTLGRLPSDGMEARISTSPTLENHHFFSDRNGCAEMEGQGGLCEAQPMMEPLHDDGDFHIAPRSSEAVAVAFARKPGPRSEVTIPSGLRWPPNYTGRPRDRSQASDGMRGYGPSEALQSAGRPLCLYRRPQDSLSQGDVATMPGVDMDTREGAVYQRRKPELVSSKGYLGHNRASEVGELNNAHHFGLRRPREVGSAMSKLVSTVREDTGHARWRKTGSRFGTNTKFIVTLDGVPSSLKYVKYDDGDVWDGESEIHYSSEEEESVPVKRHKVPERCRFWPTCESRDKCSFHHPTKRCKNFPHCNFGDKCLFVHPNCKYDAQCRKVDCRYAHSSQRAPTSLSVPETLSPAELCRFFPGCKKKACRFYHPKPCRFTTQCKRVNCYFYHPSA